MEHEQKDRRVRRSQQLLQGALLALLKEKRYEDISVQDIIERADVARSTFYVHYVDKDDLLMGSQGIFAGSLGQHSGELLHVEIIDAPLFSMRIWFQHIKAQSHILKIIAKDPAMDLAMKTLHGIIRHDIEARVRQHLQIDKDTAVPLSVVVDYLAGSLMVLIKWWLKQDAPYSVEKMDEMFQQLVMPGVSSLGIIKT